MAALYSATHDWWDDPASLPYHDALTQGAAQSGGAYTPQGLAQLIGQESSFNPSAVSSAGAKGIAQILPSTAANPGYGLSSVDPTDPTASIIFAGQYAGVRGASGYSAGGYTNKDIGVSNSGATPDGNTDTTTGETYDSSGNLTSINPQQALTGAVQGAASGAGSAASSAVGAVTGAVGSATSGVTSFLSNIGEYGTRAAVVVFGLLLIFGAMMLFKPSQQIIVGTAKKAGEAAAVAA